MAYLWIEAESFDNLGGWIVDSQSMFQMGSAYVMAHGMGIPVEDACTNILIAEDGIYTAWVRTRDWTAVWKRGTPAGRFQVGIDETLFPTELGTNGENWAWQKAGQLNLTMGKHRLALHDLTGFNGRCDAIYLTTDLDEVPPHEDAPLAAMRKKCSGNICKEIEDEFDLVVCGGGIAGISAAVAALRSGLRVALLQDRPVLGGCNSSEIRVIMGGFAHVPPYPNLGNVVSEIGPISGDFIGSGELYEDYRKESIFKLFPKEQIALCLNERVVAVDRCSEDTNRIRSVITRHTRNGEEKRFLGKYFVDSTGDAVLARMMGTATMYGREGKADFSESLAAKSSDHQVMGMSVQWYSALQDCISPFPDIDWGIEFTDDNACFIKRGDWAWETGQYRNQADEAEYIRDYALMVTYANWSFLKNRSQRRSEWECEKLGWVSPIGGKRESYRVVGDYVLTQNDIDNHIIHEDATGSMSWDIDLHFPEPQNEERFDEPFRSCAYHHGIKEPYPVPYRCLYAKEVNNLFLAGRHISMSHVAFSCVRVMRTLGLLGEVVGMAAAVCTEHNCDPRDVYRAHFNELKKMMTQGVLPSSYHAYKCSDVCKYHFKDEGFFEVYPNTSTPIPTHIKTEIAKINR